MMGLNFLSFVQLEGINKVKPYCTMMADRSSDGLINEGQLSWTLICVRFDVMTLLNNIILIQLRSIVYRYIKLA